jgi:hypothetical protein
MKLDKSAPGFVLIKPNHSFDDSSPFRLGSSRHLVWIEWEQSDYLRRKISSQEPTKRRTPLLRNPRLFVFEDGVRRTIGVAWPSGLNPVDRFHYQLNQLIPVWHREAIKRAMDHPKPYATVRYVDAFADLLSF